MPTRSYFEDLMYGRRRSPFWEAVLFVLSVLYGIVIRVRAGLYRLHLFTRRELPCSVISVGNVTLGGTGKTPTVVHVAGLLQKKQRCPAVVSRGYGRENEAEIMVVSDGLSVLVDTKQGGDEPVLMGLKLPGVPVVVGRKRYRAGQEALQRFHPDAIILDDGFQHVQLKRSLDIVLVDAVNPFGNGKLFPAGILREPVSSLNRAHAVLITNADKVKDFGPLKEIIRRATHAKIFTSRQIPVDLVDCCSGETKPLSVLRGTRVLAFSGIARPASFHALLRSLGADIAGEKTYPDHYDFRKSDLADVFKEAADRSVSMIITTEKDVVRLRKLKPDGIWVLRIELSVTEQEAWEEFLLQGL
ncbi:MAG TPA: tetraacyldisaccharide 4'-kinase [Nitrospirota bacterium]